MMAHQGVHQLLEELVVLALMAHQGVHQLLEELVVLALVVAKARLAS